MNTMKIINDPSFPNKYHFNIQNLKVKSDDDIGYQSFTSYQKEMICVNKAILIGFIVAALVLIACVILCLILHARRKKNTMKHHSVIENWAIFLFSLGISTFIVGTVTYYQEKSDLQDNSYFKLDNSDYYIQPQDRQLKVTRANLLKLEVKQTDNQLTTQNYSVYHHNKYVGDKVPEFNSSKILKIDSDCPVIIIKR